MSDDKAIKETIKVFLVVKFSISPGEAGQKKGDSHLLWKMCFSP
jgi:hypothetical protein